MLIKQFKSGVIGLFAASMTLPVATPANALISTTLEESIATSRQEYSLIAHNKIHYHSPRRVYIIRRKHRRPRRRLNRIYRNRRRYPKDYRYRKYRRYSKCRTRRRYGKVYQVCSYY